MKTASAKELDRMFDEGKDMSEYMDSQSVVHINQPTSKVKRVNVDFPVWMIEGLDKQAKNLAINRQALIKIWIAERLEQV